MLPGLTLAELTGSVAVGARISVHRGSTTLIEDLPVTDVVLDGTNQRNVKRQLSFTTTSNYVPSAPLDRLNNYGHRVHAWQRLETAQGKRVEVDLGWFLVESWQEVEADGTMSVEAVDLTRLVETDVAAWPSSPPKNQTLRAELQRLAGSTIPIVYTGSNPKVDSELQFQTDRLANLADLCAAHGLDSGMRPDGYLHFWELSSRVVETYSATDLLLGSPRQSATRKPNRYLVVGSKTEGSGDKAKETRWSFEAKISTEPYGKNYGVVRERIEVQSATNQTMVTRAANDAMKKQASVIGFRTVEIVADARLELGDVCMFVPAQGQPFKGRVTAFSLPVSEPGSMRVDTEIIG